MNRAFKWLIGLVLVPVLLLGGIVVALHLWVGSDDFRTRVAQQISTAVGVPVELGGLTVDVWPLPAIAADRVQVRSNPPLTLERIEARPTWAALLHGKLDIATLIVRNAVVPQDALGAIATSVRKARPASAGETSDSRKSLSGLPRRIVLDHVIWVDKKEHRSLVDAQVNLDEDGLPIAVELKVLEGRFQGGQVSVVREADFWKVDAGIGGGTIKGTLQSKKGAKGEPLLAGVFDTAGVEVSALTRPSHALTGKLEAHTTVRADLRELGGVTEAVHTQSKFTVSGAVLHGLDLAQAAKTAGVSKGGETRVDTLAGNIATQGLSVHVTNLVATSGALSANGAIAMTPDKQLSGSVTVSLTGASVGGALGVPLEVGGTLAAPTITLSSGAIVGAAIGTLIAPGLGTGAGASVGDKLGQGLKGLFGK